MGNILSAIGAFLGAILKAILPDIMKQGRKPRDVTSAGYDEDLQDDINSSIEEQINDE